MSIDSLKALLGDFDPAKFLPDLSSMSGLVETLMRFAVMAGPIVLLVLGVVYLLFSPKEANHHFGYKCYFGMGSVEAWRFSQKLAGMVWGGLGLILTLVMVLISNGFRGMEMEAMIMLAGKCILWEIGLAVISWLGINITVTVFFDRKGNRRRDKKKQKENKKENEKE